MLTNDYKIAVMVHYVYLGPKKLTGLYVLCFYRSHEIWSTMCTWVHLFCGHGRQASNQE